MYAMTAAHPTLPIPSYARVRNPANGREVVVRVNDRGPFHSGRIIDLSYTAALKLGLLRGVAPVEVERLTHDAIRTGAWRQQAQTFALAATPSPSPPVLQDITSSDTGRARGQRSRSSATHAGHVGTCIAAHPPEALLDQNPQDPALGLARHVGHFVEVEGAAVGPLEHPDLAWLAALALKAASQARSGCSSGPTA
eukprot:gene68251-93510_t